MPDYAAVLTVMYPGALWEMTDNDLGTLMWDAANTDPKPDVATLDAAWPGVRDARAWDWVRRERDRLLAASDWTQVADAPVDSAAWAVYRQALRDVPQDFDSPDDVVWPTPPA